MFEINNKEPEILGDEVRISNWYYDGKSLNINEYNFINNKNAALETLFHEGQHAIQSNMTSKINDGFLSTFFSFILPKSYPDNIKNDLQYMKYNQEMYVQPQENFTVYQGLLIENDARDVGEGIANKLK